MGFIAKNIIPTVVGLIFVYSPFLWCRLRNEPPESYGLSWKPDKRCLRECLFITAFVLIPLTYVSLNWPLEALPRSSSLRRSLSLAASGIAAAIIEEIFYRGWVQPLFRKKFSALWSVAFTSALFALSHVFVAGAPFLFAVFIPGCVMGFLKERHGNISTSTLFHAAGNLWAIWFAPLVWPSAGAILQKFAWIGI
ncbi:MAG: CPBP family intramembrane metalloprotease [Synergistaceae bacterium]|jgi:membrane protease YdiL (CAAX protease family)|nr:CPBP family intramembrane metalloprotease [Synergistaceae bacterium]